MLLIKLLTISMLTHPFIKFLGLCVHECVRYVRLSAELLGGTFDRCYHDSVNRSTGEGKKKNLIVNK